MRIRRHYLCKAIPVWLGLLLAVAVLAQAQGVAGSAQPGANPDVTIRLHDANDARVPPGAPPIELVMGTNATGDYRIDSLLSVYRWPAGTTTLTYSFYDTDVFHGAYYGTETVSEVSEPVKANVRNILAWYGTLMNINFVEVAEAAPSTYGTLRFMLSTDASYAYAYYPSSNPLGGDVYLNPSYDRLGDTNGFQHPPGQHGYLALVHEIGHTLGLKHPHDPPPILPAEEDNESHTVMTYDFTYSGSSAATPMGYDLMALQSMYGARANRPGNDVYQFTSRSTSQYTLGGTPYLDTPYNVRQTIWDTGGYNTVDASNLPANASGYELDLRGLGWLVAKNVKSTSQIDFAYGTVIGNNVAFRDVVSSSSADTIYANDQPNVFKGYSRTRVTGADVIIGGDSSDTLDLSGYTVPEVTDTQSGNDRILGFGANGSVTLKDYYLGYKPVVSYSPASPSFSIGDVSVTEGNAGTVAAVFTVSLSAASSNAVSVGFATSDGTATAGSDYVAQTGTLTFAVGETSKQISVVVNGDTAVEPNEVFYITLSNPAGGAVIGDGVGAGTILNDDVNQTPTAKAGATPTTGLAPLTVAFSSAGSSDPDGTIASYSWSFGDGGSSTDASPSHTYTTAGTFTAVLTVRDNLGATDTDQVTITVSQPDLTFVSLTAPTSVVAPATVPIKAALNNGAGATVVFSMMKPGARKPTTYTAIADASGVATWNYSINKRGPAGAYSVSATATLGSKTATHSAITFTVTLK